MITGSPDNKEIEKIVVREDGTILPEVPNLNHRYSLGKIDDGPLSELLNRYFEHGYREFDRLCRAADAELLPTWDCVIVPWEQIIAERSHTWFTGPDGQTTAPECVNCRSSTYGAWK